VHHDDRTVYTVTCHYADGWWHLRVSGSVDVSARVRFLDEVESQARHAIALVESVPEDSFDVAVEIERRPAAP
jgi:hypothetical protein